MRKEDEVHEFREGKGVAPEQAAAFEACIPRDFWKVRSKDVTHNKDVFKGIVAPYCERLDVARRDGYGLLLLGDNGVGKTMFLSFVLVRAIRAGYSTYYTTLPQLDHDLKRGFHDRALAARLEWLLTSDFLAIDEMAKEKFKSGDSYIRTQAERILKERFDESVPTLIATNADLSALEEVYGTSLTSILSGKYQMATMAPGDFRKKIGARMRKRMRYDL